MEITDHGYTVQITPRARGRPHLTDSTPLTSLVGHRRNDSSFLKHNVKCFINFIKMATLPKRIGWVGLGLMGLPMATNLLNKTDNETQIFVYDVVQDAIDKLVEKGQGRVKACSSSKEVAGKSVSPCTPINQQRSFKSTPSLN